jgi:hypothetical protein
MLSEPEQPANRVHRGVDRGGHQPGLAQVSDVELEVCPLDSDQRVEAVGPAPGEPAAELVGVQRVGVPAVPGQIGHRGTLGRRHSIGLEQKKRRSGHGMHLAKETKPRHGSPREARHLPRR